MISESLRGIICQQLLPSKNGDSLELALEVLLFDPAISAIVRQNQLHQLASMIQTGKSRGMCLMDESIMELFKQNKISKETAFAFSEDKTKLQ
ncbi:MAG: hypothetical protein ACD_79C00489G0001 [uncultured bacterium]|nr:MAG: hypothetical protein ACD_79C00489G0001 [uncultured bacterium]